MVETIRKNNAFFRQGVFLIMLLLIGGVMVRQLAFFVGSFLGALTFYIVFRRLIFRMVERGKWPPWLAALVIVVGIGGAILGLGYFVGNIIAKQMAGFDSGHFIAMAHDAVPTINNFIGFEIITPEIVNSSSTVFANVAGTILNTTYSFAANIFMTVIILYFMLTHARTMETRAMKYMPFKGESRTELLDDVTSIIYSNAVGIPMTMLSQGVVAGLIYWAFGLPNVLFWAFLTAMCGLIPMVGTVIVSLPLGVWFIAEGDLWKGIVLIACGVLVIANVDNLARIVLNKKISNTHPLIVIFGVILGLPLFGFWGIIFGPLSISVFLLLVRIYYDEYKLTDKEPAVPTSDAVPTGPAKGVPPLDVVKGFAAQVGRRKTNDAKSGEADKNKKQP